MFALRPTTILLLLASSLVRAQLVLENPKHLDVPEPQAQALFLTTMRVMETEFHAPGALENSFKVRLVLGEKAERFTIDDPYGNGTVYMERWNEGRFAVSAMRLAIQHLLAPARQKRMLEEIVRRTHEIAPIKAAQLREEGAPSVIPPTQDECTDSMTNAAVRTVDCRPGIMPRHP